MPPRSGAAPCSTEEGCLHEARPLHHLVKWMLCARNPGAAAAARLPRSSA